MRTLNDEEKYPVKQLLVDDEFGQVGPGGTRALMTAVMGTGTGMKGGPYKLIDSLRIWRGNCGDDGVSAIVREADIFSSCDAPILFVSYSLTDCLPRLKCCD